jgi:hypothetical protein
MDVQNSDLKLGNYQFQFDIRPIQQKQTFYSMLNQLDRAVIQAPVWIRLVVFSLQNLMVQHFLK